MVTHRVVSVGTGGIVTRGDAEPQVDPWVLRSDAPTVARVDFVVPWVGWVYLFFFFHPPAWLFVIAAAVSLAVLTRRRSGSRPVLEPVGDAGGAP